MNVITGIQKVLCRYLSEGTSGWGTYRTEEIWSSLTTNASNGKIQIMQTASQITLGYDKELISSQLQTRTASVPEREAAAIKLDTDSHTRVHAIRQSVWPRNVLQQNGYLHNTSIDQRWLWIVRWWYWFQSVSSLKGCVHGMLKIEGSQEMQTGITCSKMNTHSWVLEDECRQRVQEHLVWWASLSKNTLPKSLGKWYQLIQTSFWETASLWADGTNTMQLLPKVIATETECRAKPAHETCAFSVGDGATSCILDGS